MLLWIAVPTKSDTATVMASQMVSGQVPEKEYVIHDCCFPLCTCGGSQKIKLYAEHLEFEEHVPYNPLIPFAWSLLFLNVRHHTRVPYAKLTGASYSTNCCGKIAYQIPAVTAPWPVGMGDQINAEAFVTDVVDRMNKAYTNRMA